MLFSGFSSPLNYLTSVGSWNPCGSRPESGLSPLSARLQPYVTLYDGTTSEPLSRFVAGPWRINPIPIINLAFQLFPMRLANIADLWRSNTILQQMPRKLQFGQNNRRIVTTKQAAKPYCNKKLSCC